MPPSPQAAVDAVGLESSAMAAAPAAVAAAAPPPIPQLHSLPSASTRWRVVKLGGTSMASLEALGPAVDHLVALARRRPVAVVVSALAGVTDRLLAALRQCEATSSQPFDWRPMRARHRSHLEALASPEHSTPAARRLDRHFARLEKILALARRRGGAGDEDRVEALATGERLAAEIMLAACRSASARRGGGAELRVASFDPAEMLIAGGDPLDAEVDLEDSPPDLERVPAGHLRVMPGFLARGRDLRLRLLGRGGSDTSATLLGRLLAAERVEIWTDVDGVFPRDPRVDPGQRPFARLSYDEAERLAAGGAKVLHAKSIAPARRAGVPVLVRNSFRLDAPGTWIGEPGEPGP